MKSKFLIAWHLLFGQGRRGRSLTNWIAVLSVTIGVAALVTAMAVVSGFANTLAKTVIDVSGHIQVFKQGGFNLEEKTSLIEEWRGWGVPIDQMTEVFWLEGIMTHRGSVAGVVLQGLTEALPALQNKIIKGSYDATKFREQELPEVLLGRILAERLQLAVGDEFRVVVPVGRAEGEGFRRQLGRFRVGGILSLGKYEYDERLVVAYLPRVQGLVEVQNKVSAFVLMLPDSQVALAKAAEMRERLGFRYRVRDWRELNENLFRAVDIERVGIFFIIFVIVIAAAFNVACNLFVVGVQRQSDYAILQAMGVRPRDLFAIVTWQGVTVGALGSISGFLLGYLVCQGLVVLQRVFPLMPSSVYRIDHIEPVIRGQDLSVIFLVTLVVCGVAAILPAKKSAGLSPAEGLRYE